ncbi:MAG: restriction endonuclease subunit S [Brevinema sp.]
MKLVKVSDLFNIKYGNSLSLQDCKEDDTGIPFVSRGSTNNGIDAYIEKIDNAILNKAYTISVAVGGSVMESFYQKEPYYTGYHVLVLTPKENMTDQEMLFYCTCLRANKYKYNYGRQANATLKDILIPSRSDIPKWVYTTTLQKPNDKPLLSQGTPLLDVNKWGSFSLNDLFEIEKGERITKEDRIFGTIPLVTAISENNGIVEWLDLNSFINKKKIFSNSITVDMFCNVFYQSEQYFSDDNVHTLLPKSFRLNKYIALFLVVILKKLAYRYDYGRQLRISRLENEFIKLPTTSQGAPDWEFMENYIKTLKYSASI